jgi:hypothetical protein
MAAIWLAFAVAASLPLGCSIGSNPSPAPPAVASRAPRELVVRLLFGPSADLDLYVTGPQLETVYFANTPSRIGGTLARDVRCDEGGRVRVETVTFPSAPPGRYRVGVDFPERCSLTVGSATYRLSIDGDAVHHEDAGEISFGIFESLAFEFDYVPEP